MSPSRPFGQRWWFCSERRGVQRFLTAQLGSSSLPAPRRIQGVSAEAASRARSQRSTESHEKKPSHAR
jgi:hypothetical protein